MHGGAPAGSGVRRLTALGVVVGLLLLGGLVDRVTSPSPPGPPVPVVSRVGMPAVSSSSALSSTWYCTGATADPGGLANGAVLVTNLGAEAVQGVVRMVPSAGQGVSRAIVVPGRSTVATRETDLVQAPYASAVVSLDGGDVVVNQSVSGPAGSTSGGCTSSTAGRWYFAEGSTEQGDDVYLSLLNPGATDAVVDLSFATDTGPSQPSDFQGLVVPAGSMIGVDIRSHVLNSKTVGTTVAARIGRLVAAELAVRTSAPPSGVTLVAGAPAPSPLWMFPYGADGPGVTDAYDVYNPGPNGVSVSFRYSLSRGTAEPLELNVAPGAVLQVATANEPRVPAGVPYSVTVQAASGEGVVVERAVTTPSGRGAMLGSLVARNGWTVGSGAPPGASTLEYLVLANPGVSRAVVGAAAIGGGGSSALRSLDGLRLRPGQIDVVQVTAGVESGHPAYSISASSPLLVERDVYPVGSPGASLAIGALSP